VRQQAQTVDLLPTLLELIGVKAPAGVQGASLVPSFRGTDVDTVYSYAETLFPRLNMGWAELRSMRTNRWKYIRAPKPELYDLAQDPGETTNVIASHPEQVQGLEARLKALSATTEKVNQTAMDPRTLQQLKVSRLRGRIFDAGDRAHRRRHRPEGPYRSPPIAAPRGSLRGSPANPRFHVAPGHCEGSGQSEPVQLSGQ
jgi:hypothetical protein